MISNAKDKLLTSNPGTLPNMSETIMGWFQQLSAVTIVKTIVNFEVVETKTTISFLGVIEPMPAQNLMIKPEGQRQWIWNNLWCSTDLNLNPDDIFTINSIEYRVMIKHDWSAYGYRQYEVIQNYS